MLLSRCFLFLGIETCPVSWFFLYSNPQTRCRHRTVPLLSSWDSLGPLLIAASCEARGALVSSRPARTDTKQQTRQSTTKQRTIRLAQGSEKLPSVLVCPCASPLFCVSTSGASLQTCQRFRSFPSSSAQNFLHATYSERCVTPTGLVPFSRVFFLSPSVDRLENSILTGIASAFQMLLMGTGDTSQTARMGPTSRLWEGFRPTGIGRVSIPCIICSRTVESIPQMAEGPLQPSPPSLRLAQDH